MFDLCKPTSKRCVIGVNKHTSSCNYLFLDFLYKITCKSNTDG